MPDLKLDESIELTKIYSLVKRKRYELISSRPFRNPHHTISETGLIGGGVYPRPGEISLAHRGVLFLDEFSEFSIKLSEALRQPLENKSIVINRNNVCLLYTSDAADEEDSVDLGGRRIIKKK